MEVVQKTNKRMPVATMLDPKIVWPAIGSAFVKLDPRAMARNPVMFVVEVVATLTTVIFLRDLVTGAPDGRDQDVGIGERCCVAFHDVNLNKDGRRASRSARRSGRARAPGSR